jgi:ElaB/YqjD/DUF883 family membrane-anchored ribosome-binding protein
MNDENTVRPEPSRTTDRLAGTAHDAIDKVASGLSSAEQRVRATAGNMHDTLNTTTRNARLRSERAINSVRDYANGHPFTSLGIAFAVGLALASFMRFTRR